MGDSPFGAIIFERCSKLRSAVSATDQGNTEYDEDPVQNASDSLCALIPQLMGPYVTAESVCNYNICFIANMKKV